MAAVHAIRGGWGSARLLPYLDYDTIRRNPKVLIGYSDITALHMAIHAMTGLITFHGPIGLGRWDPYSLDYYKRVLFNGEQVTYANKQGISTERNALTQVEFRTQTITPGKARGRLLGGNLTVLTAILGSPYVPDWNDAILFCEDVGEDLYRVDRMVTQLKLAVCSARSRGSCSQLFGVRTRRRRLLRATLEEIFRTTSSRWRPGVAGSDDRHAHRNGLCRKGPGGDRRGRRDDQLLEPPSRLLTKPPGSARTRGAASHRLLHGATAARPDTTLGTPCSPIEPRVVDQVDEELTVGGVTAARRQPHGAAAVSLPDSSRACSPCAPSTRWRGAAPLDHEVGRCDESSGRRSNVDQRSCRSDRPSRGLPLLRSVKDRPDAIATATHCLRSLKGCASRESRGPARRRSLCRSIECEVAAFAPPRIEVPSTGLKIGAWPRSRDGERFEQRHLASSGRLRLLS